MDWNCWIRFEGTMCDKCKPFDGRWMETPNGLRRCDCAEGGRLKAVDEAARNPVDNPPVLTPKETTVFVEMLASIPFFPADSGARMAIGDELRSMCAGVQEAAWLATRMRRLYTRWPGTLDMRHVYCSRYLPWDGLRAIGESEVYPDGIPVEREQRPALPAPAVKALPPGHSVSADPLREAAVDKLAIAKDLSRISSRMPSRMRAPQLPVVNVPPEKRITQADIDREVEKLLQARAKQELGVADAS